MKKIKRPEILAPAGSIQCMKAAVLAGCDAIYMGGKKFGARAYADNPETEELIAAIKYCHLHDVKFYLTVNTLLNEREIKEELIDYIKPVYESGVDACLVQDMGVLEILHEYFPDMELHASTQMNIHSPDAASLLIPYGITRIVPSRELTLTEIKNLKEKTGLEVEVFVHGALCYCYSGQCLFSSMLGGRSGNRGRCAGPCRKRYTSDGKNCFFFSMKELMALEVLPELIEAGADSFKIEGRMKKPEYIANAVSVYKKYADLYTILGKSGYEKYLESHEDEYRDDINRLAELYNREGFTHGYLTGKKEDMFSMNMSGHGGTYVGKVKHVTKRDVTYIAKKNIFHGDVLEFRDENFTPLYEYTSGENYGKESVITARYKKGSHMEGAVTVYRTRHGVLIDEIREKYIDREPVIHLTCHIKAKLNENLKLRVKGLHGQIELSGDVVTPAMTKPISEDSIMKAVMATGGSGFCFDKAETELDENIFIPVSSLKKLRRQALEKYRKMAEDKYVRIFQKKGGIPVLSYEEMPVNTCMDTIYHASVMTVEQLKAVLGNEKIDEISIKTERFDNLHKYLDMIKSYDKKAMIVLPSVLRENTKSFFEFLIKENDMADEYIVKNLESFVFLRDKAGVSPGKIRTDTNLYIMNSYSRKFYRDLGVSVMTLSQEMSARDIAAIKDKSDVEMVIYGCIPLMVSSGCPHKTKMNKCDKKENIEFFIDNNPDNHLDEKKRSFFSMNFCKYCYNILFENSPLWLCDKKDEMERSGIRRFRYDFTIESASETEKILNGKKPERYTEGHYFGGLR